MAHLEENNVFMSAKKNFNHLSIESAISRMKPESPFRTLLFPIRQAATSAREETTTTTPIPVPTEETQISTFIQEEAVVEPAPVVIEEHVEAEQRTAPVRAKI